MVIKIFLFIAITVEVIITTVWIEFQKIGIIFGIDPDTIKIANIIVFDFGVIRTIFTQGISVIKHFFKLIIES